MVTYFLQLGPTSCFSLPPNNAIILWVHQGINLLIRSEPLGSNHFPKATKSHTWACEYTIRGVLQTFPIFDLRKVYILPEWLWLGKVFNIVFALSLTGETSSYDKSRITEYQQYIGFW
jgi:hypothetical protein